MNNVKAVLTAIILTAGSAASCAAADMPVRDEPMAERPPLRLQYSERHTERSVESVERDHVGCNAFGRCFRAPPVDAVEEAEVYPGPRVYAPPLYAVPDYAVRPAFREPRFAEREFEERGFRRDRRFGEPGYDGPRDGYRRSFEDRRAFEDERGDAMRPRQRWSRDERRFEGRNGELD